MTTIAFCNGVLAADSQATLGGMVRHEAGVQKIFTPADDDYWEVQGVRAIAYGFAGDYSKQEYITDLLREGLNHKTKPPAEEIDVGAIIITENGDSYMFTCFPTRNGQTLKVYPLPPPVAIGSGELFAIAAMGTGVGAAEAVAAAIRHDVNSGGEILIFEVPPKPAVPSKRPTPEPPVKTYTVDEVNEMLQKERSLTNEGIPSDSGVEPLKTVEQHVQAG